MVTWEDAWMHNSATYTKEELGKVTGIMLHVAGFLVRDDKKGVIIAGEYSPAMDNYRNVQFIPRGMVRHIFTVRRGLK